MPFQDFSVGQRRVVQPDTVIRDAFGGGNRQPNAITNSFGRFGGGGGLFGDVFTSPGGLSVGQPVAGTVRETARDGRARFSTALSTVGAGLLTQIGARLDGPAPTVQPASFGRARSGISGGTIAVLGAAIAGGYWLMQR